MAIFRERYILKGQIACDVVFLPKKNWSMRSNSHFSPPDDGKISHYRTSSKKNRCQSSCKCTQCWKSINEGTLSMIKTCFVIESINDAFCLFFTLTCILKLLEIICYLHNIIFAHSHFQPLFVQ